MLNLKVKKLLTLLICFCSVQLWASDVFNVNDKGVIDNGYDVVSYFTDNEAIKGKAEFQVKHSDATYWFSSKENKEHFEKSPEKYAPQFGGWCAYAVADSKSKVDVDPKKFVIQDGRLLLFYNGFWGDTREKWQHTEGKTPAQYLKQADKNWREVKNQEP